MQRSLSERVKVEGEIYQALRALLPGLIIFIMLPLFTLINGKSFLSSVTFLHIIAGFAPLALTAVGIFLVMRQGQLDFSVSSIAGFSAFLTAWLIEKGELNAIAALLLVLAAGLLLGALNGLLVSALQRVITHRALPRFLPSLIVTIITMFAIRYGTWLLSNKEVIRLDSELMNGMFNSYMGRPVIALLALFSIAFFNIFNILYHKRWGSGSKTTALAISVGGSLIIALLFLFPLLKEVGPLYLLYLCLIIAALTAVVYLKSTPSFALSGLLAAVAGVIIVNRLNGASPYSGVNYELNSIIIVLLAGGSLFRVTGRVGGVVMAALMTAVGAVGFVMTGFALFVNPYAKIALVLILIGCDYLLFRMSRNRKGA